MKLLKGHLCLLQLYRMYGRQSAEDVHAVLQKYNASYVILEDSICLRPTQGGCGLPSLVDAHYSQVLTRIN